MTGNRTSRSSSDREFGEYLVRGGLLRPEALRQATDTQRVLGGRLDTVLLDLGLLPEGALLQALGRFRSTRTVSGRELRTVAPEVARMISPRIALRLEVVPFRREGRTLSIASLNPSDLLVEDELAQLTDCMVASYVALEVRLYETMARLYDIQPSIQVMAVLRRLEEVAGAGLPAQAAAASDRPARPGQHPVSLSDIVFDHSPVAPHRPEQPLALEISREELEEFPSLGGAPQGELPLHGRPPDEAVALTADQLLERATDALQDAEMREDIGDAVLSFCAPILARRLLLAVRGDRIVGWRGEGERLHEAGVRTLSVPAEEPSVFAGLGRGSEFWLGALPRNAASDALVHALGGAPPAECVILPLIVRGKTVAFLYGDNGDRALSGLPLSHLRRLVAKASLAFQIYLLRSKIRHL